MIDSACLIESTKLMEDTFEYVTMIKKTDAYFGGQVISRTLLFADGAKKTLGFMHVGDYEFGT